MSGLPTEIAGLVTVNEGMKQVGADWKERKSGQVIGRTKM